MNTREKILSETEKFILKNGISKLTLSKISKQLTISQPAVYKHFKNKDDLLTTLAHIWLDDKTLSKIFPFATSGYTAKNEIIHDWLWTLASSKFAACQETPDMFALYTTYIAGNPDLGRAHIQDLMESLSAAAEISRDEAGAFLLAFSYFHHPKIAPQWDDNFQMQFEAVWQLVKNFDK
ncbi:TetR/AcrR family transcriptional regulator [Lactovum odontotermitis]